MKRKSIQWLFTALAASILLFIIIDYAAAQWNMSEGHDVNAVDDEGNIKIAAVGDSITYGSGLSADETYPVMLSHMLGNDYWVQNYGVRSHTAMSSANLPYINSPEYQESLRFHPDIALIMLGTNDSKNINWNGPVQFREEYETLIDTYVSNNPDTRIYLMTPPKAFNIPEAEGHIDDSNVNEIVQVVEDIAADRSFDLIDIHQLSLGNSQWFDRDGIHPDKEGARAIAEEVYRTLGLEQ